MKIILVPIDCSDATRPVIEQAKGLARAFDAEIHLVHVREVTPVVPPTTFGYGVAGTPELVPMSARRFVERISTNAVPNK
jgi:nucleotide-binding universal stress UspA family protein